MRCVLTVNGVCEATGFMGAAILAESGQHTRKWSVPLGRGTRGRADLLALIEALKRINEENRAKADLDIRTTSKYVDGALFRGWNVKQNIDLIDEARELLKQYRSAMCRIVEPTEEVVTLATEAAIPVEGDQHLLINMDREEAVGKTGLLLGEVLTRMKLFNIQLDELPDETVNAFISYVTGSEGEVDPEDS